MQYILETKALHKSFGTKKALQDFSIKIPKGSIYGLLGPNGAGKTTFLRIINQISHPDQGEILFKNEKLQAKHIAHIGYMPEERGLYKNMPIGEQAIYLAKLKGLSTAEAKKRLKYWFEKLNIDTWWNKKLNELSKGMGQKIQFIVTVLHQPELIIFDEPFSGFDPVNANIIRDEILELKNNGTSIIFSTHRMESVEEMCDYVALINQSKKILDGEINTIRQQFKKGKWQIELALNSTTHFDNFCAANSIENIVFDAEQQKVKFSWLAQGLNNQQKINTLSQIGDILTFSEQIPSMNEVFINAVNPQ